MTIEEFENDLVQTGASEEDLQTYGRFLKRVRSNYNRLQHCWLTAYRFPADRAEEAVRLIQWGLENYLDDWFSTYSAHLYIGYILQRSGQAQRAYEAFQEAGRALGDGHDGYRTSLSGELMWSRLQADSYAYSEELEEYYNRFLQNDEFSLAFLRNDFRLTVTRIVICLHHGDLTAAAEARRYVRQLMGDERKSRIQSTLDRHRIKETLELPEGCKAFLNSLEQTEEETL